MPHIILEHSPNFLSDYILDIGQEIRDLMSEIKSASFDADQFKIRSIAYQNFVVGLTQDDSSFLHISIKILEGRSKEILVELANKVNELVSLSHQKNFNDKIRFDFSVDIIEMNRNCYRKFTIK
jgi:5-carboxymethyl-2-hydroxymuconate isomerase